MRLDEQNRILIPVSELVPAVWPKGTYDSARWYKKIATTVRGGGGHPAEVLYDILNDKYKQDICKVLGDPRVILGLIPAEPATNNQQHQRVPFNELTPKEMQLCNARYNLVKCCREYAELHGAELGITAAKIEFTNRVQQGYICEESYKIVGKISFKTIARWDKDLRDGGDVMDALAPLRATKKGSSLSVMQQKTLIEFYCKEAKPTYASTYRMACRIWKLQGEPLPEQHTCRRFLTDWESKNMDIVTFHRLGMKAVKEQILPSLERDPEKLEYLDCLVADGRKMNMQIINPATGKLCRPTLIGWMDFKTHQLLGFELMVTENTMSVASSFRNACINAARLQGVNGAIMPRSVYIDNGSAFKNKFFNEEIDLRSQVGGLFERLKPYGLEHVQYARPYNARTKVIERIWQYFEELDQMAKTYVGSCIANKPASMMRNEPWHRNEREKALTKEGYPTLWGAYKMIEWFAMELNNRAGNGKYLKGNTPNQLAETLSIDVDFSSRVLPGSEMDCMIMNSKTLKLKPNGFKINGISYYNPQFSKCVKNGEEYIVRYDILNTERILVYKEDGTFWCEAGIFFGQGLHPMAKLGSDADRQQVRSAQRQQASLERATFKSAVSLGEKSVVMPALSISAGSELLPPSANLQLVVAEQDDYSDIKFW